MENFNSFINQQGIVFAGGMLAGVIPADLEKVDAMPDSVLLKLLPGYSTAHSGHSARTAIRYALFLIRSMPKDG